MNLRFGLFLICAAAGCGAPRARIATPPELSSSAPSEASDVAQPARQAVPTPAPPRWRATGEICVRLTRLDLARKVRVEGVRGAGTVEVDLDAPLRDETDELRVGRWLEPANEAAGLRIQSMVYPGRIRVRGSPEGGLCVENIVDLEDYVAGVVACEVQLIDAPPALLEAQAIASRSYAIAQLSARGSRSLDVRLQDGVRDQVYRGRFVPTRDPASVSAARQLDLAMKRSAGQVLFEGERVLDARFHAACGGRTADGAVIFPETAAFQSLRGVDCGPCAAGLDVELPPSGARAVPASMRDLSWHTTLPAERLAALTRRWGLGSKLVRIESVERDGGGRWLALDWVGDAGRKRIAFETLRRELPDAGIASSGVLTTWPRVGEPIENGCRFAGRGRGHGVGLCQYGARCAAAAGQSAEQILAHYYPGARVADGR